LGLPADLTARESMTHRKSVLSERLNDTLIKIALIDEMARVDNWQGLDECLENNPGAIKKLALYADAALRALKQIEDVKQIEFLQLH
jgi:hypothetical protein